MVVGAISPAQVDLEYPEDDDAGNKLTDGREDFRFRSTN